MINLPVHFFDSALVCCLCGRSLSFI